MIILTNRNLAREICALWCGTPIPSQIQFSLGPFSSNLCTRTWAIILGIQTKRQSPRALWGGRGETKSPVFCNQWVTRCGGLTCFYIHMKTLYNQNHGLPWWSQWWGIKLSMQEIQVRPLIWEATKSREHACRSYADRKSNEAPGVVQEVKNPSAKGRPVFDPWVGKIPWRKAWQPTAVFLPGESPMDRGTMGLQRVRHAWVTKHRTT